MAAELGTEFTPRRADVMGSRFKIMSDFMLYIYIFTKAVGWYSVSYQMSYKGKNRWMEYDLSRIIIE